MAQFTSQTLAGTFTSNQEIQLEQIMLPEFFKTRKIDHVKAKIFTTQCQYDMILGRDLLNDLLKNPYSRFGLISSCADQFNSWCSPMLRCLFTCIFHNL